MGTAARAGRGLNDLPSDSRSTPAQQSVIYDAAGGTIANPTTRTASSSPGEDLPWMQKAQIAIEDSRFYQHGGLDLRGFTRALVSNFSGGDVQGASTLTQQYVKITLQENALRSGDKEAAQAATAKNYMRKLQELKYAMNVEQNFTKDQILAGYLNLVYYGDQAYGVEAASQNYYGIPASDLDLGQAALLAGIVQQPTKFNPVLNPENAQQRRDLVLTRMEEPRSPPPEEVAAAKAVDVKSMLHKKEAKGVCHRPGAPLLRLRDGLAGEVPADGRAGCDPGRATQEHQPGRPEDPHHLNPTMQSIAVQRASSPRRCRSATTRTSVGGHGDRARHRQGAGDGAVLGLPTPPRSVECRLPVRRGPLRLAVRLHSEGLRTRDGPRTRYAAQQRDLRAAGQPHQALRLHQGPGHRRLRHGQAVGGRDDYSVGGEMSLQKATSQSINTAFAALTLSLGGCSVRDTMTKMGLHPVTGSPSRASSRRSPSAPGRRPP